MGSKVFRWAFVALASTVSLSWAQFHDSATQEQQEQHHFSGRITEVSGSPVTYDHGYPIHPFGRCAFVETDTVSTTFYCRRGYYCSSDKHCWEKDLKEQHARLENTQDYELDFLLRMNGHASGVSAGGHAPTSSEGLLGPEIDGMVPVLGTSFVINWKEGRCNVQNYICGKGYICSEHNYCILESEATGVQPCPNHRNHELSGLIQQGKIRPGSMDGQHGCDGDNGSCTSYECEKKYYHYSRTESRSSQPNPNKCHDRSSPATATKQRGPRHPSTQASRHQPLGNHGSPRQGGSYECTSYECEEYQRIKTTKATTPSHTPSRQRPQPQHGGSYECTECEKYKHTKTTKATTPSHTPTPQRPRAQQHGHGQPTQHGVFSQTTTLTKTEYKKYCMNDQECMTCMTQSSVEVHRQVECIMGAYSRVKQPRQTNGLVNTVKNFAQDVYSLFNRYRNDYSASRVLRAFDKQIAKKDSRIAKLENDNNRKGGLSDMRTQELGELVDSRSLFKNSRDQFDHLSRAV
ncbi:hypothetical protein H4R34_000413 [Dimargaris verticillata]|uniref:Uncharacterized protein n=1 Tax=Dimargaris verticillata TaxID=2761393 RepID=A0A9W8EEQ3_9FUNG|nr:hypothetical protein H4R34_000413 [Dimargaris verticillata]